jgi:hypothetical protein
MEMSLATFGRLGSCEETSSSTDRPFEAIVLSEQVESYVWMIRAAVDMTPGFELSNLKVIFGDGILAGETLLHQLGITQSCRIVLDRHHLLSGAIGAWPKKFGLVA